MLQHDTARQLYTELKEAAAASPKEGFADFYKLFLRSAADYAATRTAWATMDSGQRIADDRGRRAKHDAFISLLNAVCRNLGLEGVEELLPDRKTQGDFACYIALFQALEQR